MTSPSKPALLIYRDGRLMPTGRIYNLPNIRVPELWPLWATGITDPHAPLPILHRDFHFLGEAGPYAVYAEV